jgi:hypothetical protein
MELSAISEQYSEYFEDLKLGNAVKRRKFSKV